MSERIPGPGDSDKVTRLTHFAGTAALAEGMSGDDFESRDEHGLDADTKHSAGDAGRRRRLRIVSFDDITLSKGRRYLVKGLIPRGGLAVVWGPPKSFKSFWTFDLMMHVALDWEYRGRRVQQGTVVYCAFEGQTGVEARVEAFRLAHLDSYEGPVPFYLQPVTMDLVGECSELIEVIRERLGETAPAVVVLDTLNRSMRGSESSDQDMGAYIKAADAIREAFGCAVIVVHHCGIAGDRPRGHTSLTGAADAQLAVKRNGKGSAFTVEVEFMKDGPEGARIGNTLETVTVGTDEDGDEIVSGVVRASEAVAAKGTPKGKALAKGAQVALGALETAIAEAGEVPPASNHIPHGVRAVQESLWRKYAYSMGISNGEERARQLAFERAYTALNAAGVIGVWQDWCWLA